MKKYLGILFLLYAVNSIAKIETFKVLHPQDLEKLIKSNQQKISIYDVNMDSTRKFVGIISGAKLLSSSNDYDVVKELPQNKTNPLIFYCANELCTASHSAAKRAIAYGYSDVSVMVDGIYGWKKAGLPLTEIKATANNSTPADVNSSTVKGAMNPREVKALVDKGQAIIVDVRESEERHQIIEGSLSFPMSQVNDEVKWIAFQTQLPKNKIIIFHCAAGVRSKKVATILANKGFKTSYFEGPDQWEKSGLPLLNQ